MQKKHLQNNEISKPLVRLSNLVKVLTPGQKRAFKRDAKFWRDGGEASLYVQLFDEICKYTARPESEHKKSLLETILQHAEKRKKVSSTAQSEKTITLQDISVRANYLYDKILESLRFVSTRSATFKELNGKMQDIYFLYNNDLFKDCLRLINDTIKLALTIDRPAYVLELCALQRRILFAQGAGNVDQEAIENILKKEQMASDQMLLYNQLTILNNKVMQYRALQTVLPVEEQERVIVILERFKSEEMVKQLGIRTRFQLFVLFSEYYKSNIPNLKTSFINSSTQYGEKIYQLLKEEPTFKEDEFPLYQLWVIGHLLQLVKSKNFMAVEKELADLAKSTDDKLFQCKELAYIQIQVYIEQDRYTEALEYIRKIKLASNLRLFNSQIWPSRLITLFFLGAYASVMGNDYFEAGRYAKMIAQDPHIKVGPHLRMTIPFIQALVHFETNPRKTEDELVEELQKTLRNLTNKYKDEERLKILIHFAQQLKLVFAEFIKAKKMSARMPIQTREKILEKTIELYTETKASAILEPLRIPVAWVLAHLKETKVSDEMK